MNKEIEVKEKKLTDKEEAFCQAYVNDAETRWNKTQSAIKVGYSPTTARSIGCDMLAKPYIKDRVAELCRAARESNDELVNKVLGVFKEYAFNPKEDKAIRIKAAEDLAKYTGMDKISVDVTTGGEPLPININIIGVKPE